MAKQLVDPCQRSFGLKITDQNYRRVAEVVPLIVVAHHVGGARALELFQPASGGTLIGMLAVSRIANLILERLPWTVQPDPQLLFNNLLLSLKLIFIKEGVAHAAGLDVESRFPPIRGEGEVIGGEVEPCKSVVGSAV